MEKSYTRKAILELGGDDPMGKVQRAAQRLGVSRSALYQWMEIGPPEPRCFQLAALTTVPLSRLLQEART